MQLQFCVFQLLRSLCKLLSLVSFVAEEPKIATDGTFLHRLFIVFENYKKVSFSIFPWKLFFFLVNFSNIWIFAPKMDQIAKKCSLQFFAFLIFSAKIQIIWDYKPIFVTENYVLPQCVVQNDQNLHWWEELEINLNWIQYCVIVFIALMIWVSGLEIRFYWWWFLFSHCNQHLMILFLHFLISTQNVWKL